MSQQTSYLNPNRPPVFCPGCSHEQSLRSLDKAFGDMGLKVNEIVLVTDIGCAGLFDVFFNTHAMHGLHGRALTYAAGIKLACPSLKVVVIMGDGGLGIGGAHLLEACRRNLDLTLIVLNNFNFGMTGGQFSSTTPSTAAVSSGFLNTIEKPMDVCSIAAAAGASFVSRLSAYKKGISALLAEAITFDGFALVDIWGMCPGRYGKKNHLSPKDIEKSINELTPFAGEIKSNLRPEYGSIYRKTARKNISGIKQKGIEQVFSLQLDKRREVLLLGSAGDHVISAGSLLAYAAVSAGMHVTQKSEYNVTVMRGPSITELILAPEPITYTGVEQADVIVAISQESVIKRSDSFGRMKQNGCIILAKGIDIPDVKGNIQTVDFKAHGIKKGDHALASLAILAEKNDFITLEMLENAVRKKYHGTKNQQMLAILIAFSRTNLTNNCHLQ